MYSQIKNKNHFKADSNNKAILLCREADIEMGIQNNKS